MATKRRRARSMGMGDEARAAYEEISSRIMADILAIKE